jgi:16S rRNA (uracil1498-N3)-methyltransferase
MPHFLIENYTEENNSLKINNEDILKHLFVMRCKSGEIVKFINTEKIVYKTKTIEINKKNGEFEILEKYRSERELDQNICLCFSILKNSLNEAIANAVQVGVKKIQPVLSDYCAVKKNTIKIEKLKKIALENFKQCERADIPEISEEKKLKEFLSAQNNVIVFGEREVNSTLQDAIQNIDKNSEIIIVIGPEGGFSDEEFEFFKKEKYPIVTLGKTILKAENAIVAGVSNVIYELNR